MSIYWEALQPRDDGWIAIVAHYYVIIVFLYLMFKNAFYCYFNHRFLPYLHRCLLNLCLAASLPYMMLPFIHRSPPHITTSTFFNFLSLSSVISKLYSELGDLHLTLWDVFSIILTSSYLFYSLKFILSSFFILGDKKIQYERRANQSLFLL